MRLRGVWVCGCVGVWLAGCATQTPEVITMSDAEVVRRADGLTATMARATETARAMATGNALATATRAAAMEATADAIRATEVELEHRHAWAEATSEQFERELRDTQLAAGATMKADEATAAATAARAERENDLAWQATARDSAWAMVIGVVVVLVMAAGGAFIAWRVWLDFRRTQMEKQAVLERQMQGDRHEMEMMRLRLEAFSKALRETKAGTVLPMPDGRPLVLPPAGPASNSDLVESDAPPAETITVNAADGSYEIERMSAEELASREMMMALVKDSIAYHNRLGRKGRDQRQVVDWRELRRMGFAWDGGKWQAVRNLFGEALVSRPRLGTFPAEEGMTLEGLLNAVKWGQVKVTPLPQHRFRRQNDDVGTIETNTNIWNNGE